MTLFLLLFSQGLHQSPETAVANQQRVIGLPLLIQIPVIHVETLIESVGASSGSMDVPILPEETAWYMLGPRPGEAGTAVIDGHVNWINNAPAVFGDLHKLKSGDKVMVQDDQGLTTSFVVRESRTFSPNADASEVFGSSDGQAHLNLITCSGVWDKATDRYSERLVVFTDKEIK